LGLATANSLAAISNGARQIECTINGIGERAGNTALEEVVMAIHTRKDIFPFTTGIDTRHITRASRLVQSITGAMVQVNKAIVGANAFAHESGIHQDGVLKHAGTYEIMTPESVGLSKSNLVLGKHSGRHAFKSKLQELGLNLGDNSLEEVFEKFKELADKKKDIYDNDLIALVDNQTIRGDERVKFVSLTVNCGSKGPATAELELEIDGKPKTAETKGDGPVDAAFNAIKKLVPIETKLVLYQVSAITKGTDAQAEVTVRLEKDGVVVNGSAADTDTIVASVMAYISALNKLPATQAKTLKPETSSLAG